MQLDREAVCHGKNLTWRQLHKKQFFLFSSFSLEKLNRKKHDTYTASWRSSST